VGRLDGVLDRLANLSAAGLSPGQPPATYASTNLGKIYLHHLSVCTAVPLEKFQNFPYTR
jgi:hypothetical protein